MELAGPTRRSWQGWAARESAKAEVYLVMCCAVARRTKTPQPHLGPRDVRSLSCSWQTAKCWEDWASQSPSAQVRRRCSLYVVLDGKDVGEVENPEGDDRWRIKEQGSERQCVEQAPARTQVGDQAGACEPWACEHFFGAEGFPYFPGKIALKEPRPSKLPMTFNVQISLDILTEKDSKGSWLNIVVDQGTTLQTCALLCETRANPTILVVLEALAARSLDIVGWLPQAEGHGRPCEVLPGRA